MARKNELLMRKGVGVTKSTLADFGFAVTDVPWPVLETKELAARDWPGEHGTDVYIPQTLSIASYDIEVAMVYKGSRNSAYAKYTALRDFLCGIDGAGAELMLYDPYKRIGRSGVYLVKIDDSAFFRTNIDEVLTLNVTFRVTDPVTDIKLE